MGHRVRQRFQLARHGQRPERGRSDLHALFRRAFRMGARLEHALDRQRSCADGAHQRAGVRWLGHRHHLLRLTTDASGLPRRLVLQRLAAENSFCVSASLGRCVDPAGRRPLAAVRHRRGSRMGGCQLRRQTRIAPDREPTLQAGGYRRRPGWIALCQRLGRRIRRGVERRRAGQRRSNLPDLVARCAAGRLEHVEARQTCRAVDVRRAGGGSRFACFPCGRSTLRTSSCGGEPRRAEP